MGDELCAIQCECDVGRAVTLPWGGQGFQEGLVGPFGFVPAPNPVVYSTALTITPYSHPAPRRCSTSTSEKSFAYGRLRPEGAIESNCRTRPTIIPLTTSTMASKQHLVNHLRFTSTTLLLCVPHLASYVPDKIELHCTMCPLKSQTYEDKRHADIDATLCQMPCIYRCLNQRAPMTKRDSELYCAPRAYNTELQARAPTRNLMRIAILRERRGTETSQNLVGTFAGSSPPTETFACGSARHRTILSSRGRCHLLRPVTVESAPLG